MSTVNVIVGSLKHCADNLWKEFRITIVPKLN